MVAVEIRRITCGFGLGDVDSLGKTCGFLTITRWPVPQVVLTSGYPAEMLAIHEIGGARTTMCADDVDFAIKVRRVWRLPI